MCDFTSVSGYKTDRECRKATVRTCDGALFGSATCNISLWRLVCIRSVVSSRLMRPEMLELFMVFQDFGRVAFAENVSFKSSGVIL